MDLRGYVSKLPATDWPTSTPLSWRTEALRLHHSTLVLFNCAEREPRQRRDEFDLAGSGQWGTCAMLASYALECLLKGMAVAQRYGSAGGAPPRMDHNLVALARDVGIALTEDEAHVCGVLSEFAIYLGRYPSPSRPKFMHDGWGLTILTFEIYDRLFDRIDATFLGELRRLAGGGLPDQA
jgi:hypothetical protein